MYPYSPTISRTPPAARYYLGVDLGQTADYTALALVQRTAPPPSPAFDVVGLERLPTGTTYPAVVAHAAERLAMPQLQGCTTLVVDATGVGRPVVDALRAAHLDPVAVTITGGDAVTQEDGRGEAWRVPKRDLVSGLQVLLQAERLKIARALPFAGALVDELLRFRVKIDPVTARDSYGVWREGKHDDLVLALAVAVWKGSRPPPPPAPRLYSVGGFVGR